MSRENNVNEIERITQCIAAIDLEKEQLTCKLSTLQNIVRSNSANHRQSNTRVTTSDLAARTGEHIPPKYHQFASLVQKNHLGKRIYIGDTVLVTTRGNKQKQEAVVAYLTEFKVTVILSGGFKSSREASLLEVVKSYDRQGKPF